MSDCPFCARIAAGEYDLRDGGLSAVTFKPLRPVVPGHRLVVPVRHVTDYTDQPYITGQTAEYAARIAALFDLTVSNLITSAGAVATQTIPHLHFHLVPRREGDGLALPWTGQQAAGTDSAP